MESFKVSFTIFVGAIVLISEIGCDPYPSTYIKNENPGYIVPGPVGPVAQEITYNNIYNQQGLVETGLLQQPYGLPFVQTLPGAQTVVSTNPFVSNFQVNGLPLVANEIPLYPNIYSNGLPLTNGLTTVPGLVGNQLLPNVYVDPTAGGQFVANNNPLVAQNPYLTNRGNIYNL